MRTLPSVKSQLIVSEDSTTTLLCQTGLSDCARKRILDSMEQTIHILSWKPADFIHSVYCIYFIANLTVF